VEVDGRSLLERHLTVLASQGIDSITVIGGYLAGMLVAPKYQLKINHSYAATNMVWTLFCAESDIEGDILIAYGDIVYSPNILHKMMKSKADIAVAVDLEWESYWRARNENPLEDAESLKMTVDNQIIEIGKKPQSIDEIQGQYMGIIRCSPYGASKLKEIFYAARKIGFIGSKPVKKAYMTDLIQFIIDSGQRVEAVPVKGDWIEIDTVSDLLNPETTRRLTGFFN
jgi:choline kinase